MNQNDKAAARAALADIMHQIASNAEASKHAADAALAAGWRPPLKIEIRDREDIAMIIRQATTLQWDEARVAADALLSAGLRPPVAVADEDRTELVRILGDGQYQTTTAMADAILATGFARAKAPTVPSQREPDGFAYVYASPFGTGEVLRFSQGTPWNGHAPLRAIPYWLDHAGSRKPETVAAPAPAPASNPLDAIPGEPGPAQLAGLDALTRVLEVAPSEVYAAPCRTLAEYIIMSGWRPEAAAPAPDGSTSQLEDVRLAALAVMGDQYQKHATLQIVELALAELTARRNDTADIRRHILAGAPHLSTDLATASLVSELLAHYATKAKDLRDANERIGRAYRALEKITTARPDRDIVDMAEYAVHEFELLRSRRDSLKNVLADTERSRTELQAELASLLQVRARATTALATLNGLLTNAAADSVDDAADLVAELLASIRTTLADESKRLDAMNVTLHNAAAERGRMTGLLNSTKAAIGDAQLEIAGIPAAVAALRADLQQARNDLTNANVAAARLDGELRLALSRVASHAEELDRMRVASQTSRSQEIRRLSLALMTATIANPNMTKPPTWPGCVDSIKELFAITEGKSS